jgi:hypothetical protein
LSKIAENCDHSIDQCAKFFSDEVKDWFLSLPNSVRQCFFRAAAANNDVLNAVTACRESHGGVDCSKAIPEIAACLP